MAEQVFCQLFGHPLGQCRYKHTLFALNAHPDFLHQVVYLVFARAHLYLGVEQPRGAYHLLYNHTLGFLQLIVGRCGRDVDHLVDHAVKLVERERAVVECSRKPEPELHQVGLARPVASIHGVDLWHADMALVDKHKVVFREEVEQAVGAFARVAPVEIARVVLYARAMAELLYHLHVVFHPLLDALGLDGVAQLGEIGHLLCKVVLYVAYGDVGLLLGGHEQVGRI